MLELKHIQKIYEGDLLLGGIDFQLNAKEIVCLLGTSGSGKSTLLRIISGIEKPDGGSVLWEGIDITHIPTYLRGFGLMFQDYALFPHLNVAENVAFGLRMKHDLLKKEIDQRVNEMLELVSMQDFAHRKVTELSGGEQQRIALARALAPQPKLLMLDEPLAATDRALRESLGKELMQVLKKADIPVIYVTHDQEEAFAVADRIALLHGGIFVQVASPQEIYAKPKNLWAAQFFGFTNQLEGIVRAVRPTQIDTSLGVFHIPDCERIGKRGDKVSMVIPEEAITVSNSKNQGIMGCITRCVFQGKTFNITAQFNKNIEISFEYLQPLVIGQTMQICIEEQKVLCYPHE